MKIAAMLRVKNEARWISRVLASIEPLCNAGMYVFDDNSTDNTVELSGRAGAWTTKSLFKGINETRDKNHLLDCIMKLANPDWVLHIDGDEELEPAGIDAIRAAVESNTAQCYSLQVLYLWNNERTIRTDGIYKNFFRQSLFSTKGTNGIFNPTSHGKGTAANLHCTNVPHDMIPKAAWLTTARLLHYGYIDRDMRLAKWDFYNTVDPDNVLEDRYRHIVAGDIPEVPAWVKTKWAGPLTLENFTPRLAQVQEVVNA
jgi:glycosyltransferase involved in cell wall biosynthesis